MIFKPLPCKTRWEGLTLCFWIVLIDLLLLVWAINRSTDRIRFLLLLLIVSSIPLLIHLLYRTWCIYTLEYWVDRNAVTIVWGNVRQIIPLHTVKRIVQSDALEVTRPSWWQWPGPYLRNVRTAQVQNLHLLATRPTAECLMLDTGAAVFAISPENEAGFMAALQERFQMGAAVLLKPKREHAAILPRLFGENPVGLILIAVGLIGVLALFGLLMVRFPTLPAELPFRYTKAGAPESIHSKSTLFVLPAIGMLAWLANGLWGMWMVYRKQVLGAYMLWGGALIVQICSLLALRSLLP
ncbi:MAG: PH domain-containing protein [Caldilineaceae bacterium]